MTVTITPAPTPPTIPSVITPTTLATLVGSLAAYVLGVLTYTGVVLPPSVNAKVQAIIGLVTVGIATIGPIVAMIVHHSVQKVALKAAAPAVDPAVVKAMVDAELARLVAAITPAPAPAGGSGIIQAPAS